MIHYINAFPWEKLRLRGNDLQILKWFVDKSFAVHPDFKSHMGGALKYCMGVPILILRKEKLNTRNSTETELVTMDFVVDVIHQRARLLYQ